MIIVKEIKHRKEYVAGFIFNQWDQVLLIKKNRPDWQKGKYNGIGGKVEEKESPRDAMRRECIEECGLDIKNWTNFLILEGHEYVVHFFFATTEWLHLAEQKTDEEIEQFSHSCLPQEIIPNLKWIIPLSRDKHLSFPIRIYDNNISGG